MLKEHPTNIVSLSSPSKQQAAQRLEVFQNSRRHGKILNLQSLIWHVSHIPSSPQEQERNNRTSATEDKTLIQRMPYILSNYNVGEYEFKGKKAFLLTEVKRNRRLTPTGRGEQSQYLHVLLHTPSILREELDATAHHDRDDGLSVWRRNKVKGAIKDTHYSTYHPPERVKEIGLFDILAEAQSILLDPDVQLLPKGMESSSHKKSSFSIANSVEPTNKPYRTLHISRIAKNNNPKVMMVVEPLSTAADRMTKATPGAWTEAHEKLFYKEAWITCGPEEVTTINSIQINYVPVGQTLEQGLGEKGKVHRDKFDERDAFSCIFFLRYLPKDAFPGSFSITTARLTCTATPFSGLIFTVNDPHGGSATAKYPDNLPESQKYHPPAGKEHPKLPENTPYRRLITVQYPKQHLFRARVKDMAPEMMEDIALGCFTTKSSMMNGACAFQFART